MENLKLSCPLLCLLLASAYLFPSWVHAKKQINVEEESDGAALLKGKRIFDKRFRFPNVVGEYSKSDFDDLGHHAGYYKLNHSHDARLFYFFFESRSNKTTDPVVLWLSGGPGCSSEIAMFYENGPFSIADNMTLHWNDFGWDKVSNLLYVDQPVGTGFSYTSDDRDIRHHSEHGVSNDLYDFLQAFFEEHPEFVKNDFYITGESYAGHYIPALAFKIHQENKEPKQGNIHINLKGFAIGNGYTDPAIQSKAYADYALYMKIMSKSQYDYINRLVVPVCEASTKLCATNGSQSCVNAYYICQTIVHSIMTVAGDINPYDIRKKCSTDSCYDLFLTVEKFLNQKSVKQSLGVKEDIEFVPCSYEIHQAMILDQMKNFDTNIPALLEDGIQVLIYAGEYDFLCNWIGNKRWVYAMEWSGRNKFVDSYILPFQVDGVEAGVLKNHGVLTFLKVHNSGHMVPMDQPKVALEMLARWFRGDLSKPLTDDATTETTHLVSSL